MYNPRISTCGFHSYVVGCGETLDEFNILPFCLRFLVKRHQNVSPETGAASSGGRSREARRKSYSQGLVDGCRIGAEGDGRQGFTEIAGRFP